MTKPKLSYLGNVMRRRGSLEKMKIAGKEQDPMRDGSSPSKKLEAEPTGAEQGVEDGTRWTALTHRATRSQSRLDGPSRTLELLRSLR